MVVITAWSNAPLHSPLPWLITVIDVLVCQNKSRPAGYVDLWRQEQEETLSNSEQGREREREIFSGSCERPYFFIFTVFLFLFFETPLSMQVMQLTCPQVCPCVSLPSWKYTWAGIPALASRRYG